MDYGAGFAQGIAIGVGAGFAINSSDGNKKSRKSIARFIDENGISIQDKFGKPIKLDDFLDEAYCRSSQCCSKSKAWCWVFAAMALSIGAFVYAYLLM